MTPRDFIRTVSDQFRRAGIPDPENDAALILAHLTGRPSLSLRLDTESELDPSVTDACLILAGKRLERFPLQYLLQEAPFYRRLFRVNDQVLIPRPETELLCEWALDLMKTRSAPAVLDLCCGSGCIGLTVKAELPSASVCLSDLSAGALDIARENADRLSLDVSFRCGDLLEGVPAASFDLIVCNPPYIPSSDCPALQPEVLYEPVLALDGGPDGLSLYRRIASEAFPVLSPGGFLLLELGAGQAPAVASLLAGNHFTVLETRRDYAGIERMILAGKP